jgi:hypothetical protein
MPYNFTVTIQQPEVAVSYAPAPTSTICFSPGPAAALGPPTVPVSAPISGVEYFVYRCAPTNEHPVHHWKYYPATMSKAELPDIRSARPLFTWSSVTGQYSPVSAIGVRHE